MSILRALDTFSYTELLLQTCKELHSCQCHTFTWSLLRVRNKLSSCLQSYWQGTQLGHYVHQFALQSMAVLTNKTRTLWIVFKCIVLLRLLFFMCACLLIYFHIPFGCLFQILFLSLFLPFLQIYTVLFKFDSKTRLSACVNHARTSS